MSYSTIIQKDLPLATWELEEVPSSSIACDRFLGSSYNGSYNAAQVEKKVPIIFGSTKSVHITSNGAGLYAMQVPSLDKLSLKTKYEQFSIEFWIKFTSRNFAAPTTMTKIMGKPNSSTGIYIHNSSIIAIVGDTMSASAKAIVAVPNIKKPLHIVLSYSKNTVSLSVNGQTNTSNSSSDVITKAYVSSDEYFRFFYPGTNLEYAIDQITMYSRVLNSSTIKRHIAYGFGYEIPNQVARQYGGYRYNLSMAQTPVAAKYEKAGILWQNPSSISNMTIEDGCLRINKYYQPELKYAKDKTSSVFSWSSTYGLQSAAGGYVELPNIQSVVQNGNYGFAGYFNKDSTQLANGVQSTLMYFNNSLYSDRYVRFYLVGTASGEDLMVQVDNGEIKQLLSSTSGAISGTFSCGLYYDSSTQKLSLFAGHNTLTAGLKLVELLGNDTFYADKIRLGSSPVYSNSENYADITSGIDKRFTGGILRVSHVSLISDINTTSFQTINTSINGLINNYSAVADSSTQRFIIKAKGSYTFAIDMKRLAGTNLSFIGNHRIEWGSSSSEVSVKAIGKQDGANWMSETTITNNSSLSSLLDVSPGTSKYLNITISIDGNDVELNPTKIYYFRFITYPTINSSGVYSTAIISDGPNININSTTSLICTPPSNTETPFLFNEESDGVYIANTATIQYSSATLSNTSSSGMKAISFFINLKTNTTSVLSITDSVTTYNISYDGTSLSGTNVVFYIDGSHTTNITPNMWHHVIAVFNTRLIVSSTNNIFITFGKYNTGEAGFNLDEIMTIDTDSSILQSDVTTINSIYKGANISSVGDSILNKISIIDNESYSNSNIYQPINNFTNYITPVDLLSTTLSSSSVYDGTASSIYVDGKILLPNDRVLLSNGIYTVASSIIKSQPIFVSGTNPLNSIVYIKDGNYYGGKFYGRISDTWQEVSIINKIRTYSVPNTPYSSVKKKTIVNI